MQFEEQMFVLKQQVDGNGKQRMEEWTYFTQQIAKAAQIPFDSLSKAVLTSQGDKVNDLQHNIFELVKSLKGG